MNLRTLTLAAALVIALPVAGHADSNRGNNSHGSHGGQVGGAPSQRPNSVQSGQQTQSSYNASVAAKAAAQKTGAGPNQADNDNHVGAGAPLMFTIQAEQTIE